MDDITYLYPNSNVLINNFDIKDAATLSRLEAFLFATQYHEPIPKGNFDYDHLKSLHKHFFGELYPWAGEERRVDIIKGSSHFGRKEYLTNEVNKICDQLQNENYLAGLDKNTFCDRLAYYFNEINAAHPFREGNGRTLRAFCDQLADKCGFTIEWKGEDPEFRQEYLQASIKGFEGNERSMADLLNKITTAQVKEQQIKPSIELGTHTKELLQQYAIQQEKLFTLIHDPVDPYAKHIKDEKLTQIEKVVNVAHQLTNQPEVVHWLSQNASQIETPSMEKVHGISLRQDALKDIQNISALLKHAYAKVSTHQQTHSLDLGQGLSFGR